MTRKKAVEKSSGSPILSILLGLGIVLAIVGISFMAFGEEGKQEKKTCEDLFNTKLLEHGRDPSGWWTGVDRKMYCLLKQEYPFLFETVVKELETGPVELTIEPPALKEPVEVEVPDEPVSSGDEEEEEAPQNTEPPSTPSVEQISVNDWKFIPVAVEKKVLIL